MLMLWFRREEGRGRWWQRCLGGGGGGRVEGREDDNITLVIRFECVKEEISGRVAECTRPKS
jgi:hypothetical protein